MLKFAIEWIIQRIDGQYRYDSWSIADAIRFKSTSKINVDFDLLVLLLFFLVQV